MKALEEITCCTVDAGTFIPLADMMGRRVKKSYYYSPFEQEYLDIKRCVIGDGFENFERLDEFLDPDVLETIDLFLFPDIGYRGLQRHLRHLGKLVWGSMGASDLELFRTRFLRVLKDVGLPVVHSETIRGLANLSKHLQSVEDKWVKINRYRDNMETWHHQDYQHSQRELERLAVVFGPLKEHVVFVVQDPIQESDDEPVLEIGYDGWCIDGQFPQSSFQGYEKKNELYLGSLLQYSEMPESVRLVNQKMGPVLEEFGYRNFWATEIRQKGDEAFFIDPTARMAGQTMEHLLETCSNLPEVILAGAQGEVIQPEFLASHSAEATIHYKFANGSGEEWKTFRSPPEAEKWLKFYRCCYADGAHQFPPRQLDELGIVFGSGDSIQESIDDLSDHFELLKDETVSIDLSGFADLINEIQDAESEGMKFTDQSIPEPATVLEKNGD